MENKKGQFKAKDLTGLKIGMLTALEPTGERNKNDGSWIWLFRCDCGNTRKIASSRIKNDWPPYSCGCTKRANPGQAKVIDLAGQRNFMVVMIEPTSKRSKGGYAVWKLQCDCGKIFERPSYCFIRKTVTSCGCTRPKPVGRTPLPNKGAYINQLFSTYKKGAKERSLEFNLTKDECRDLFEQNCHYCGSEPPIKKMTNLSGEYAWNGIDRKDNNVGYTLENCVTCCKACNFAKVTLPYDDFLSLVKRIYEHMNL